MTIFEYLDKINSRYKTGISTEHSYRGDLQNLLETLAPDVMVTNEPARIACGAPDYIITRKNIPIGYVEAKDIASDLNSRIYKEQFDRYCQSLNNLIITDYLDFHLYIDGVFVTSIRIGDIQGNKIIAKTENFTSFTDLIKSFCTFIGQTIKSASKLSKMMAAKARLLATVIEKALEPDINCKEVNESQNINLLNQYESFKEILIHDITYKGFADIYAQTIAYGMFAARLHDTSLGNFSRQEAAELIPKSNPFLRKLFQYVAGYDLDDRIKWIVDALADIFRATNVEELLKDFGKATHQHDPIIHFYETFLSEYDPTLRKSRGVWYTPEPVVNFIIRAVDDILKSEFGLLQGLADISKIKIKVPTPGTDESEEKEVHRVQILDPAAGTGTFLAEVIKQVHHKFEGQDGIWSHYVDNHLVPRLNGFEILMASYAMAHLKLDLLLKGTGYKPSKIQRLQIYLTNSLEEHHPDTGTLFANWLSTEANEANHVKRDTPVMVILGNPPYSGESSNKGKWILDLMEDYKKEPGGKEKLKEKNSKWINADENKFIRYGQYYIEKNKSGILAFINPHTYLDNPTFRGMRWNLLKSFDSVYILDLHGNSNKHESCQDGSPDQNIFDIMQGVSINIFIKTDKKRSTELAKVFHFDLFGKREEKYNFLFTNSLKSIQFEDLPVYNPDYFLVKKNYNYQDEYRNGISVNRLFKIGNSGVVSKRDRLNIHENQQSVIQMLHDVISMDELECRKKYSIPDDVRDWNFSLARKDILESNQNPDLIRRINYRPFDKRFFYYTGRSKGVVGWPVPIVSEHLLHSDNLGLMTNKKIEIGEFSHCLIYRGIVESHAVSMKEINYVFPLYLYPVNDKQRIVDNMELKIPNINFEVIKEFARNLGLEFVQEKENNKDTFAPIDILDYIYSVLHSPKYRKKYKEFLKIDFPWVPYQKDKNTFWNLVSLGGELRQIHLLESPVVDKFITTYPINGSNEVEKFKYEDEKVWISNDQYFDHVPKIAWESYIGGYQPAQKWLKDRKGKILSFEDIMHYQKIIVALSETDRIMKEIDTINFF